MPSGRRRFTSLASKLLAVYLPLVSGTVIVLFAVVEIRSFHVQLAVLRRAVTEVVNIQSGAFTAAVWEYNTDQLDLLLADLGRTPHFRGAVVSDSFGEVLARAGDVDDADPDLRAETPLVYQTEHVREEVGRLILAFDREELHARLRERLLADALVLAVLILVLIGVTVLGTRLLIVRPIAKLRRAIDRARAENVREVVRWESQDELGQVVDAYNEMQTKQAAAEAALNEYKEHLEHLVDERTVELRDARDAADLANRAKSDFLSNMSHELRTPLNGVLGYAQILQRDADLTAKQKESLGSIESCGQHLLTLINDVLDLSKIEAGRLEVEAAPCDLHRLLKSVFDIVRPRAESKGLEISMDVSPEVPIGIVTDATKLKQTLVNLLGNAVKFTEDGSVSLHVQELASGHLEFAIRDTGIGMTPDEMEQIFDPFKQAGGGKASGGTGLGLAISKRIAAALGGTLAAESTPGEGSCFTVALPLEEAREEDLAAATEASVDEDELPRLAEGQSVTVLVADDRETNRDILVKLLEAAGFDTIQAADGEEALARLREHAAPVALMDVRMPVMNGIEATKAIREDPALEKTVVIAVTASVFPDFKARIAEAGFDDFIAKPFRAGEVFRKIRSHLDVTFAERVEEAAVAVDAGADAVTLPLEAAREVARRLREASRVGNVSALTALASELDAGDGGGAAVAKRIGDLARSFDFGGIESLADELEASPAG